MKKPFLPTVLFCLATGLFGQAGDPIQWLDSCVDWVTKHLSDIESVRAIKLKESPHKRLDIDSEYAATIDEHSYIVFSVYNNKVVSASRHISYTNKKKFYEDVLLVRRLVDIHNGRLKFSEKNDPEFGGGEWNIYGFTLNGKYSVAISIITWGTAVAEFGDIHISVDRLD